MQSYAKTSPYVFIVWVTVFRCNTIASLLITRVTSFESPLVIELVIQFVIYVAVFRVEIEARNTGRTSGQPGSYCAVRAGWLLLG